MSALTVNIGCTLISAFRIDCVFRIGVRRVNNILYTIILFIAGVFMPVSCVINELAEDPILAEGKSSVSFDVQFRPLVSVGAQTRTAGDAIKHIESLWVLVYKSDGSFYSKANVYPYGDTNPYGYTNSEMSTSDIDLEEPEGSSGFAEAKYCHSTFKMDLPLGEYRIYAVANYDLSSFGGTEDELKSINLAWNASDISANNPMFGYFTDNEVNTIPSEAPLISINKANKSLHAWVKRAASKVTVSFDGSNLYENVYIYIHTVQIKDIPASCWLGKDNKPNAADQLIADGESVSYRTSSTETDGLRITKGAPYGGLDVTDNVGGVHHENANSLFFFENRQPDTQTSKGKHQDEDKDGNIDHPDGNSSTSVDFKDGVPYGTYIEVKGYYINKTAENPSQGPIVYRFMLGKDTDKSCDAERSNHYKLVLRFNKDANNPDWHIEYKPESPEISVPSPLYISYGYNEVLNIPVLVRGASVNDNLTIKAEIIHNPWGYPEHKYYGKSNHEDLNDGFLSFDNTKGTVGISESDRNNKWVGTLTGIKPTKVNELDCQYTVPVYTRPLILSQSLTGHNPYVSYDRRAKVRFTVVLDGKTYTQEMEVIQVKRLVNPTGVWRSNDNTSPFDVCLMELNEPDANEYGMVHTDFYAPHSDGPWTAHIEEGADWVEIAPSGSGDWGTADVVGGTGTEIRFDYRPKNTNTTGNVRCGVIRVTYHNNTCVHYVFVSQGNGTVNLAGTKWRNRNVKAIDSHVSNPLLEGSMFKFGNPWWGILVENNHQDGYGFDIDCWGKTFTTTGGNNTFEAIGFNLETGFTGDRKIITDDSARPANYAEWKALEALHRRYGVLYGDECNETKTTTTDAYSYWQIGHERGMQGMFVWDESRNGNHVFFPIGSTGNGHRKVNDNAYSSTYGTIDKYSHLKYAQRPLEMPEATAKAVPMYYDIWLRKGAVYWYDVMYSPAVDFEGSTSSGYGHDINFHSMLLQTYGSNAVGQYDKDGNTSTDACYIRCVEP